MIVPVYEFLNVFQAICAPTTEGGMVWVPPMFSSMQVFVFDDAWVEDTWNPFWWEYLRVYRQERNQPLENNQKRCICDAITARAETHFEEAMRRLVGDEDVSAGAKRTRINLPPGESLNRVPGPGGHELIVLATTKNQKDVNLYAYEPQNRLRTPLLDAVGRGVVVRAQWV